MRLLIGGAGSKFFHLKEFSDSLERLGVETKLVLDSEIYDGFPSRNINNWLQNRRKFKKLIYDFKPDLIFVDRQRHFSVAAVESKIPVLVHLRGDFWSEIQWARETTYKSFVKGIVLSEWEKMGKKCFESSSAILPICQYLADITKKHYPSKDIHVLRQGITPSRWFQTDKLKLKHPCVGFLQGAVIWGKAKEMLILPRILESMSNTTFYWVGDGPYREQILKSLSKFENFKWLGPMKYPDEVRDFLSEIDIYGLMSGIDMSPLTLKEAQLMKKPVIATDVGGIPEIMVNNRTGFLVKKENPSDWIDKIDLLLKDNNRSKSMGEEGRKFIESNFNMDKIAKDFVSIADNYI